MKLNVFRLFLLVMTFGICRALVSTSVAATWYVDGNVAASGNGNSWATALKTIADVQGKMADGQEHLVLIRGDNLYYEDKMQVNDDGISETQRIVYRGVPGTNAMGRLPIVHGATNYDETAFSPTNGYDKVFWIQQNFSVYEVWEGPLGGEWGYDWTLYDEVSGVAAVQAATSSWDLVDGKLYVHTSDSTPPSNFIIKATPANRGFEIYASYLSFENLEMRHYRGEAVAIMGNSHQYVTFRSNIVHHTGAAGLGSWGTSHIAFEDNTIFSCPGYAIECKNYLGSDGSDIVISGNTIENCGAGVNSVADRTEMHENSVAGSGSRGVITTGADNSKFYNNMISGSGEHGLWLRDSTNCWVYNNTLYANQKDVDLETMSTGSSDAKVFNNLIWAIGSGKQGIRVESLSTNGLQCDYNLIYTNDGAVVGEWAGSVKASLSDWQAASGQDTHSIGANPRLVNPAAANLHLAILSPCIDAGTPSLAGVSAPAVDIDGDARPVSGTYEIGADEYIPTGTMITIQ